MWSWCFWACLLACSWAQEEADGFTKGQKWQIILLGTPDTTKSPLPPTDAQVWDIDLFDSDASTVAALKALGKTVICYFSAGTYEDWREDANQFPAADLGKVLPEWPDEKWIRTGSAAIRNIMGNRIKLASTKGCDAIDPDNTDGYQNDNGLNLKSTDAVDYVHWLQANASSYGLKIGLKNSIDILNTVAPVIDFAVNEQCASLGECDAYDSFLASNKPVFHIEYPTPLNTSLGNSVYCVGPGTSGMSTVLKNMNLDGQTVYCDGSLVNTPTKGGNPNNPGHTTSKPPKPISSRPPRPTSTRRSSNPVPPRTSSRRTIVFPTTTQRPPSQPSSQPARTSSPRPPTSTANPGGGGGCKSKHWDQCGGQNWNGCTVCESPYTCKGVSPPYYYQCL